MELNRRVANEECCQFEDVPVALREARVWGPRQKAIERAARRVDRARLERLLAAAVRLDAISKGIGRGDVWDEIRTWALDLAQTNNLVRTRAA